MPEASGGNGREPASDGMPPDLGLEALDAGDGEVDGEGEIEVEGEVEVEGEIEVEVEIEEVGGGVGSSPGSRLIRSTRRIPEATVARLPVYLRCLLEVVDAKTTTISSERLAEMAGVNAAKVRKDLSYLGSYGTRGVGYDVEYLFVHINRVLGLTQDWPVVIVGVGNLGHALANYGGFSARGFRIAALLDADPRRVGERIGEVVVRHVDDLPALAAEQRIAIGVIATPAAAAQEVADRLVEAGVRSILNFAPAVINVPRGVFLRKVDLSIELQILAFYQQRQAGPTSGPPVATVG